MIDTVGVVGLGQLGRGIAACLVGHGLRVIAVTRDSSDHETARRFIATGIDELIEHAGFDADLRHSWQSRYEAADGCELLAGCDMVIESVTEDAEVKRKAFDAIERVVRPDTVIASNTSAISIGDLQRDRRHADRFIGMHWAEPAHATRFLELIRGEHTSDRAMHIAAEVGRRVGKDPSIVQRDVPGFIVNRLAYAVYREAMHLIESGVADAETIDRSFSNALGLWSTFCGPLRWMDLTGGPALYAHAMRLVLPTLSNVAEPPAMIRRLADADARGVRNGHGFYDYSPDEAEQWEARLRQHAWTVRAIQAQLDAHTEQKIQ